MFRCNVFRCNGNIRLIRKFSNEKDIIQTSVPPGMIDLGLGQPGPELLPTEEVSNHFNEYVKLNNTDAWKWLQYGQQKGSLKFRKQLAKFLNSHNYHSQRVRLV